MPQCTAIRSSDNERCRAAALKDRPFCFRHDPEKADEALAASRRGGENFAKRGQERLPDFSDMPTPESLADVASWQARVAEALVRGELDPKRGREITHALRSLKEILEATEQGKKADDLMAAVAELRAMTKGARK